MGVEKKHADSGGGVITPQSPGLRGGGISPIYPFMYTAVRFVYSVYKDVIQI